MTTGKFITIEGPDGGGKTTNIKVLAEYLRSKGYEVVLTREPGGTPVGEKIRNILLNDPMCSMAELLMFNASRANHIEQLIKPAIERGAIVISDRFSDSSYAYQGIARGFREQVLHLEEFVHKGFEPDHTLFFDITLEESMRRLQIRTGGNLDVFEREMTDFRAKVYQGYRERFEQKRHRMVAIDAMKTPDEVAQQVLDWAKSIFG